MANQGYLIDRIYYIYLDKFPSYTHQPRHIMLPCNFSNVDWGKDDAKGDTKLSDYFVSMPMYSNILAGDYRYIIGRKGTGKTAIAEMIRIDAKSNPLMFTKSLSLKNFPLNLIRDFKDKQYRDKSQFVPIWTFLILIELIILLCEDNGINNADIHELKTFITNNFGSESIGFNDAITTMREKNAKISIPTKWIGISAGVSTGTTITTEIHFQKATEFLLKKILTIHSESQFFVLIDELDEGFRAGDKNLRLILLALLRAIENLSIDLNESFIKFLPLVLLRSDIFDMLEDNDLNKLDDYIVRLNWTSDTSSQHSLLKIVNARIRASLEIDTSASPWDIIVKNRDSSLHHKVNTVWDYMCNRTLERPRDIIKFLKICKSHLSDATLTFSAVKNSEMDYSRWLYNELSDEIHSHLPIWRESLQCITQIGIGKFKFSDIEPLLCSNRNIKKWLDDENKEPNDILEFLFNSGVIGNLDSRGRWLFKYKSISIPWDRNKEIIVHYGFQKKLRLKGR